MELLDAPGAPLSVLTEIRAEVFEEIGRAQTQDQFGAIHSVFRTVTDIAIAAASGDLKTRLIEAQELDYKSCLVEECCVNGNVSIDDLVVATSREIAAGRMKPDHSLRKLAEMGMAAPHLSREQLLAGAGEKSPQGAPSRPWWKFWAT